MEEGKVGLRQVMLAFCKTIPARNWLEIPCNKCFSFWNLNRTKSFKKERHQEQNIKTTEYNFKAKETNSGSRKNNYRITK